MAAVATSPVLSTLPSEVELARWRFEELQQWLMLADTLSMPLHAVEIEQEKRGREIMRLLLQAHLDARGPGDVGPALHVISEDEDGEPLVRRHGQKRSHLKKTLTIFGAIMAARTAYYARGAESIHPLDNAAWLPPRIYGYELQRRLMLGVVQGPFDEGLARVEESTGVVVPKRSAEILLREAATDFDAFYAQRIPPPATETGPIAVASSDCKGVPMVKPEEALRVVRLGKGKKANKKRMATVATVYTQQPRVRTPEEVVESLFYEGPRLLRDSPKPRAGPEHKRVWASLEKSKDDVIAEVAREIAARDPEQQKTLALVVDGERALQNRLVAALPRGVEILDLLHVLPRLWKAAYCFHAEGSDEAKEWVRSRTLRILQGEVSQVTKGMRQSATKHGLSADEREAVDDAAGYFKRNRHRMRYDEYLRQGLPIASGAVEGACKNLVNSRMERSGMRWTMETGEAMLRLRAVYLSGDFEEYWQFHIREEQRRQHRRWKVVPK
jgi:hypothetical protein